MWFLRPRHTLESVAQELIQGLEQGTIVLSRSPESTGGRDVLSPPPNGETAAGRMSRDHAAKLIELLETVQQRPHMFFGKPDIQAAIFFLYGVDAVLQASFGFDSRLKERVIVERGWQLPKASGPGIESQMIQRGKSPPEVIEELVAIEIDVLQRLTGSAA